MDENDRDNAHPERAMHHIVTFRLGPQMYALPIQPIVQIVEMVKITPIPQVNPWVQGVINVRGVSIPVINLRRRLELPEAPLKLHTPIILVQAGERLAGIIVDAVQDVLDIADMDIACPPDMLPGGLGNTPLLQGLFHGTQGAVLLLDLDHLFAADRARFVQTVEVMAGSVSGNGKKGLPQEFVEVKA